jgi:hypothetical protein
MNCYQKRYLLRSFAQKTASAIAPTAISVTVVPSRLARTAERTGRENDRGE